ncbi:hypothetical protein F5Y03DRAFT_354481 [Xylaria venustula]|nr:hypothetical protein F5Y03DRAFT_354481 [Xylaria venustula]
MDLLLCRCYAFLCSSCKTCVSLSNSKNTTVTKRTTAMTRPRKVVQLNTVRLVLVPCVYELCWAAGNITHIIETV